MRQAIYSYINKVTHGIIRLLLGFIPIKILIDTDICLASEEDPTLAEDIALVFYARLSPDRHI